MSHTVQIDLGAQVAPDVKFGSFVRIYPNAVIGAGSEIGDFCVIGQPTNSPRFTGQKLVIGPGSTIRSHAVIYEGSEFGPGLETGHHVVIREGTKAGANLRVGNFSDIEGDCVIGDYCRFHGYVHVGKGSKIGHFVWLFSLTTLTNDPLPPSHLEAPVTIEDGVVVAVECTIMPGAVLGRGCFISSGSQPRGVIPAAALFGQGKVLAPVTRLFNFEKRISHPWMSHFKNAYPPETHGRLDSLASLIREDAKKLPFQSG